MYYLIEKIQTHIHKTIFIDNRPDDFEIFVRSCVSEFPYYQVNFA